MNIKPISVEAFELTQIPNFADSVRFQLQDISDGKGRLTVESFGNAWSAYWNAMGTRTLREFLIRADADYIRNNLIGQLNKRTRSNQAYLYQIVEAMKAALVELGKDKSHG